MNVGRFRDRGGPVWVLALALVTISLGAVAVKGTGNGLRNTDASVESILHSGLDRDAYSQRVIDRVEEMADALDSSQPSEQAELIYAYWRCILSDLGVEYPRVEKPWNGVFVSPTVQLDPASLQSDSWTFGCIDPRFWDVAGDARIDRSGVSIAKGVFVRYITDDCRILDSVPDDRTLARATVLIGSGSTLVLVNMATGRTTRVPMPAPVESDERTIEERLAEIDARERVYSEYRSPEHDRARTEMRKLKGALRAYRIIAGHFPEYLSDMRNPLPPRYPSQFRTSEQVPFEDPWGNLYRFEVVDEARTEVRVWSLGLNGIDEDGRGDDLVAQ